MPAQRLLSGYIFNLARILGSSTGFLRAAHGLTDSERHGRADARYRANRETYPGARFWPFSEVRERPLLKSTTGSNGS